MDKNAFIKLLFARAKEEGFGDCEACVMSGEEFDVCIFKGEVLHYTSAANDSLGFRGLYNGKMGVSSTQVYDEESIDQLLENAKESAMLIESEDEQFLYAGDAEYPDVQIFAPELETITAGQKIALAKELEKAAMAKDARMAQARATVATELSSSRIVNTLGLDVSARSNVAVMFVASVAAEEGRSSNAFATASGQDFAKISGEKEKLAGKSVKEATDFLSAASVPSGEYPVIFRNDAAASLLTTFAGVFSAENAQKGLSLLQGREGETVAAKCITITDDPLMPGMSASTPFDGEGVATRAKNVVEEGKLVTLLHNLKTAKKQGVATTGNASRAGVGGPVRVAPTNFFIQPGEKSFNTLCEEMGEGLVITSLQGLHAGANPISGDFSLGAKGYKVEGGKVASAVEQITVAANFFKLMESITDVGSDLDFGMPGNVNVGCPSLRAPKIAVAGK